ncbi:MAG: hypothetical protein Q4D82_02850, partial [Neisseria sp.]|nr:hypothetical protein [Neisseria sp.]
MKLTLVIPDLLWQEETPPLAADTSALNELLRFGTISPPFHSVSDLYRHFLWQDSLRGQALRELGLPSETAAVLGCPVWQQMRMHSMNTLSGRDIAVSNEEAARLCRDLSEFYVSDGLAFYPYRAGLWLITLPQAVDWQVPCALDIYGQVDGSQRAEGRDAALWLKWQTEIQMFLHAHPLNAERAAQGRPGINGLWLWTDLHGTAENPNIAADNDWSAQAHETAPYDWTAFERLAAEQSGFSDGIIVLDDLSAARHTADAWAYRDTLSAWDARFFAPAWQALKEGRLKNLVIHTNGGSLTVKAKA